MSVTSFMDDPKMNFLIYSCKADSSYEYCNWHHEGDVCEFEWKRSFGSVKKQVRETCCHETIRTTFVVSKFILANFDNFLNLASNIWLGPGER